MASVAGATWRFDISRVIQRTFQVVGRNFTVFAILALMLAGLPSALTGGLLSVLMQSGPNASSAASTDAQGLSGLLLVIAYPVGVIGSFILQAALTHGTITDLNGRRAAFGECFSTGLRNALWLLLLAIVVSVAEVFGYILLVFPGLMMATAWVVVAPVRVVERTGVFGAMGRSADLTRGHRWAIFGLMIIFTVGAWMLQLAILAIVGGLAESTPYSAQINGVVLQPLVTAASSLIGAAGIASIYYELRSGREGVGPEALAAVFD